MVNIFEIAISTMDVVLCYYHNNNLFSNLFIFFCSQNQPIEVMASRTKLRSIFFFLVVMKCSDIFTIAHILHALFIHKKKHVKETSVLQTQHNG